MSFPRLLWEEPPGWPSEGGAGEGAGHGRAFHPAVQQPAEEVRGAHGQHLPDPGPAQQRVWLGFVFGKQNQHQGQLLPDPDGMYVLFICVWTQKSK